MQAVLQVLDERPEIIRLVVGIHTRPRSESQYTSVHFGETLQLNGMLHSIGTVGDAYDNALAETTIGFDKHDCVRTDSPFAADC